MLPYRYEWFDELSMEVVTFIFFALTAYKFQPTSNNPYLKVGEDELDLAEINQLLIDEDNSLNENNTETVLDLIEHDYYMSKEKETGTQLQPSGPDSANPNLFSRKQLPNNDE